MTQYRKKPVIVWGIEQFGMLLPFLIRSTRRQALDDCADIMRAYPSLLSRSQMRRLGYRVVKLVVSRTKTVTP